MDAGRFYRDECHAGVEFTGFFFFLNVSEMCMCVQCRDMKFNRCSDVFQVILSEGDTTLCTYMFVCFFSI